MVLVYEALLSPPREHGVDERDDAALLESIATRKDRDAFSILYARYEKPAFNLAFHLTHDREMAEEVLQEAMFGVWTSAASFQPGNAHGWIMRIVANKSAYLARQSKRSRKRMECGRSNSRTQSATGPGEQVEQKEMISALHRALGELSNLDRQLVALSHAAGLTHEEIARDVQMPKRTVSHRIQKALELLEASLVRSGYSAAAPLLAPRNMLVAFGSGWEVSPGLQERVLLSLNRPTLSPALQSESVRRAAPPLFKGSTLAVTAVAVTVAAAATLWLAKGAQRDEIAVAPPTKALELPSAPAPTLPAADLGAHAPEAWQPASLEGITEICEDPSSRTISNVEVPDSKGAKLYRKSFSLWKNSPQNYWQTKFSPEGTAVTLMEVSAPQYQGILFKPELAGAQEWTATLDYHDSVPSSFVHFIIAGKKDLQMFGKHQVGKEESSLRIAIWPDGERMRVCSLRKPSNGNVYSGGQSVECPDGDFQIGFAANTKISIRNLRCRKLPSSWTPAQEPYLLNAPSDKGSAPHGTQ